MRVHLLSDLHLENAPYAPSPVDANVVVLAGDIYAPGRKTNARAITWARAAFPGDEIVQVAGNHEFYRVGMERQIEKLREEAGRESVHFLERASVVIQGIRFLGATLWTDFSLAGDVVSGRRDAGHLMNDYRYIRAGERYRRVHPMQTEAVHIETVSWLREAMRTSPEPTVVVTHMAPSIRSLNPDYLGDRAAPAYASDLEWLIEEGKPLLWLHGHTHHPVNYRLGATRVVSNPRGYTSEGIEGFQPDLVLEI